jgi:hypothetical protein
MKCAHCLVLNAPSDTNCIRCGSPLGGSGGKAAAVPGWAYVFVAACGLIPVVTLGGCLPVMIGISGAGGCMQLARLQSLPAVVRILACVAITVVCWILLGVVLLAIATAMKS